MAETITILKAYSKNGIPELMEKVWAWLEENFGFEPDISPSLLLTKFPEVANALALHLHVDLHDYSPKQKKKQQEAIFQMLKVAFNIALKGCQLEKPTEAYDFVLNVEAAFLDAQGIHGGLEGAIDLLDFESAKESCAKALSLPPPSTKENKVKMIWKGEPDELERLAYLLSNDYEIIRWPKKFIKLFSGNPYGVHLFVNQNKIGHFVLLIARLVSKKDLNLLRVEGGGGFWIKLEQVTFDFERKLLANSKKSFRRLSSDIRGRRKEANRFIINEVQEILATALYDREVVPLRLSDDD